MTRVAVIVGSASVPTAAGIAALPISDRGALALALARFGGDVCAYAADADAGCFARAAGVEHVAEISNRTIDRVDVAVMGGIDVALIGRGGCGDLGDALPAWLAEGSGAALVYDVIDVRRESDRLVVTRDLGRGARDLLGVRGRVVLAVADSVARGPYVSRYRLNAQRAAADERVREAPCEAGSMAHPQASGVEWKPAAPRVRLGDHAARVAGRAVERMNALFGVGKTAENTASLVHGSPGECARHLLRYLSHHDFVDREAAAGLPDAAVEAFRLDGRGPTRRTEGDAPIPLRARRRPRPVDGRPLAARGPFEIGVDI